MNDDRLTKDFKVSELACSDGCGFGTKPEDYADGFLDFLQLVRDIYGRPIYVTSGARCANQNRIDGGVTLSAHKRGAAIDAGAANGYDRHCLMVAYVLALAVTAGEISKDKAIMIARTIERTGGGFGVARGFCHLDTDVHLPRPSSWGYPPKKKKKASTA